MRFYGLSRWNGTQIRKMLAAPENYLWFGTSSMSILEELSEALEIFGLVQSLEDPHQDKLGIVSVAIRVDCFFQGDKAALMMLSSHLHRLRLKKRRVSI